MLSIRYMVPLKDKIDIGILSDAIRKEVAYLWENMKNNRLMKGVECAE